MLLRSNEHNLLAVPRANHKAFGDRAFAHSGPSSLEQRNLPREIPQSATLTVFKSKLTTYFFRLAYNLS